MELSTDNCSPIGIFDSGVGGLTVLKEINRLLPCEDIIYLGDTARVPYGIRSAETVLKYSIANAEFLVKQNIKLLVIACNTVSAVAKDRLREKYSIPVVDVVTPGARGAVDNTTNRKIGVIGTRGTISSGAYQKEIDRLEPGLQVFTQACPLFVSLAEEGLVDPKDEIVDLTVRRYLDALSDVGIDTLVLGCTHYPLLKNSIKKVMGDKVRLIDSAEETARQVEEVLLAKKLSAGADKKGKTVFYLTDIPHIFKETGRNFLGRVLEDVKVVDIM